MGSDLGRRAASLLLAFAATTCAAPPPASPASFDTAAPSAAATRTLNPNELARQSPRMTPSTSPPATPALTPLPTGSPAPAAPPTEMEALIPLLAGGGGSDVHAIDGAAAFGGSDGVTVAFVDGLARYGAGVNDVDGAFSSCCSDLSIVDMRVPGVPPPALAQLLVTAAGAAEPGSQVTTRKVAGLLVTRVRPAAGSGPADSHVVVVRDVVFVFAGPPGRQADVDATIEFMLRPRLELVLPATIAGKPVARRSAPASALPAGGSDMCSLLCPGEAQAFAAKIGVPIRRIDFAYAASTEAPGSLVIAFRVPGVDGPHLIAARIAAATRGDQPFGREDLQIGGKTVTRADYDPFPSSSFNEYLYAHDHVLFTIRPVADEGPPTAAVVETITALP